MNYIYPTASTTAIFINGYHIEQAYQIQYKEATSKIPIYGYNDYYFSKVAIGRSMVQGVMVINYIFAGYLNSILDSKYVKNSVFVPKLYNYGLEYRPAKDYKDNLKDKISSELKTELPPNGSAEEKAARAQYIASLLTKDAATRNKTIESLNEFWSSESKTIDTGRQMESPLSIDSKNLTLDIYYQDPKYQTWFVRFDNVHFFETSQVISQAGAEGSSDPLYEIYNWIASKRTIQLVKQVV